MLWTLCVWALRTRYSLVVARGSEADWRKHLMWLKSVASNPCCTLKVVLMDFQGMNDSRLWWPPIPERYHMISKSKRKGALEWSPLTLLSALYSYKTSLTTSYHGYSIEMDFYHKRILPISLNSYCPLSWWSCKLQTNVRDTRSFCSCGGRSWPFVRKFKVEPQCWDFFSGLPQQWSNPT